MTYKEHYKKWRQAQELVFKHNEELIREWRSIPWYKFWQRPSFEEQRRIILENWAEFDKLPQPRLSDYFTLHI